MRCGGACREGPEWDLLASLRTDIRLRTAALCSAAGAPDGTIASASEDNTARLWRPDGTCLQVIEHPGCVWDVAFLPNGDLVTACSDYAARVWTRAADRVADSATIEVRRALPNCPLSSGRAISCAWSACLFAMGMVVLHLPKVGVQHR